MTRHLLVSLLLLAACGQGGDPVDTDLVDAAITPFASGGGRPPPPPVCLQPIGPAIDHSGAITTAQTWSGRNIHTISADTQIAAAVTITPCTHVQIAAGATVTIQTGGSLVAQASSTGGPGNAVIERRDAAPWARIRVMPGGNLTLDGATVDGGGAVIGAITLEGGTLTVQDAGISNSAGYGLVATSVVTTTPITGSGLTIWGAASAPVLMVPYVTGSLPAGTYTGNHANEIEISAVPSSANSNLVTTNQTWRNPGVPYHVTGSGNYVDVESLTPGGVATLTIEPGTFLRFDHDTRLAVERWAGQASPASGALIARGTVDAPIVFTSAASAPQPGDWVGIYFGGFVDPNTQLDHTVIAFAGGYDSSGYGSCHFPTANTPNDAAIRVMGEEPGHVFVTNSVIVWSKLHGIDRGWRSAGSTTIDFLAATWGNSFVNLPTVGCDETLPADPHNTCPAVPRCGP